MRVFNNRPDSRPTRKSSPKKSVEQDSAKAGEYRPAKERPRMSDSSIRSRVAELQKKSQAEKLERAKKMNEKRLQGNSYMNEGMKRAPLKKKVAQAPPKALKEAAESNNKPQVKENAQVGQASEVAEELAKIENEEGVIDPNAVVEKDHLLNSDIVTNDPNSEETQEKLKTALSMGSFAFSEKERNVLDKILNQ